MYTSDVEGLLSLLMGSEQSGTLILQPDMQTPVWQACITLDRGRLTACVMTASNSPSVRREPTTCIAELRKHGTMWWSLEPPSSEHVQKSVRQHTHAVQTYSGSTIDAHIWHPIDRPCRMKFEAHPPSEWERLQRSTFALIDNKRTVQEIARILHKSLEELQPFLQNLYQSGWIGKL